MMATDGKLFLYGIFIEHMTLTFCIGMLAETVQKHGVFYLIDFMKIGLYYQTEEKHQQRRRTLG